MNRIYAELMDAPSMRRPWCVVCGRCPTTGHHVVPRSLGGHGGPVLDLCGHGTTGHHGLAEQKRLHFRFGECWWFLCTEYPTRYARALEMPGWCAVQSGVVE